MSVTITGNTYPVRAQLHQLGGVYQRETKSWLVPDDKADEARKLVEGAAAESGRAAGFRRREPSRYKATYGRFGRGNFTPTGGGCRCEDYPCCGH